MQAKFCGLHTAFVTHQLLALSGNKEKVLVAKKATVMTLMNERTVH